MYAYVLKGARSGMPGAGGVSRPSDAGGYERPGMPLKGHDYHAKTDEALRGIMKDAHAAALNARGWDPKNEGRYLDQVNDASTVLHYRRNAGVSINTKKQDFASILKFNPYHDPQGEFTSGDSATFISTGPKFATFLARAKGMHTGPNRGGGYSGKVAAGIARVTGQKANPDHRLVTGMASHTVDVNAKTKEEFQNKRADIHALLSMDGFKHKGVEYADRGVLERHTYEHPNGATAVVEHDVQSVPGASKWIGTEIFHNHKAKKGDSGFYAQVMGAVQSIAQTGAGYWQVLKGLKDQKKKPVGQDSTTVVAGAVVPPGSF